MSPLNTSLQDLRNSWKPEDGKIVKYRVGWEHRRKVSSKHRRSDAYINSLILKQHVQGLQRFGGSKLFTPSITYVASTIDKSSQIKWLLFSKKKKNLTGITKHFQGQFPCPVMDDKYNIWTQRSFWIYFVPWGFVRAYIFESTFLQYLFCM